LPDRSAALVTFSGVEGGGKTTSSHELHALLQARGVASEWVEFIGLGVATRALRLWHRLRGTRPQARDFEAAARREKTAPGGLERRRPLADARRAQLHAVDVMLVRRHLRQARRRGIEVVVFDRYFYDALVRWNLPDGLTRALGAIVKPPDLAFLVVVDPEVVSARRGDAAVEVARARSARYHDSSLRHPPWILLPCRDRDETRQMLSERIDAWLPERTRATPDPAGDLDAVRQRSG
jgi:thymidylate kinase